MAARDPVLEEVSNAADFLVYPLSDQAVPQAPYDPEEGIVTCVVHAINVCRGMLAHEHVRSAFIELVRQYCQTTERVWFLQGPMTEEKLEEMTDTFLKKVLDKFPLIFLDHSLYNPDSLSTHCRHAWDGEFKTSDQAIVLNGQNLAQMFTLRVIADPSDPNDFASRDYRNYLFITATSIFHEISHVFFTYLMKGVGDTPPQTKAYVVGHEKKTEGESGSRLEQMVLGGVVYLYRDRDRQTPVDACGTPFLLTETGWYQISQDTIENTIKCNFTFPFGHSDIAEDHTTLKSKGYDMPDYPGLDPQAHSEWPNVKVDY